MKGNNLSFISIQDDEYWTTTPHSASVISKNDAEKLERFQKS